MVLSPQVSRTSCAQNVASRGIGAPDVFLSISWDGAIEAGRRRGVATRKAFEPLQSWQRVKTWRKLSWLGLRDMAPASQFCLAASAALAMRVLNLPPPETPTQEIMGRITIR
ncbi:hypothetical protein BD414DRAFT_498186 [Trametes punicea]|nr:hypothetical protein BD414DRAFT_498186 [Trametes punicea]